MGSSGDPFIPEHLETNSAAALTALQLIDNIVKTEDAGHSSGDAGVMMMAVRNDAAAVLAGTDLDYIPLSTNSSGSLNVNIASGASSGTEYTEGATDASITGTAALWEDGSDTLRPISETYPLPTLPRGNVAHGAADSGNPIKVGGKARQTNPTAVDDADRVDATFDDIGRQVIVLNQVRDLCADATVATTNATETTLIAAVASTFLDITCLVITNASATATTVTLRDDTAGTTRGIFNIAANGGIVIPFPVPVKQAVVNKPWTVQSSATVNLNHFVQVVKNV